MSLQGGGCDVGLGAAGVVALVLAVGVGAVDGLDVVLQAAQTLQGDAALVARRRVLGRGRGFVAAADAALGGAVLLLEVFPPHVLPQLGPLASDEAALLAVVRRRLVVDLDRTEYREE